MMMRSHSRDSRAKIEKMYLEGSSVTDGGITIFIKPTKLVVPEGAPSLNRNTQYSRLLCYYCKMP